MIYNGHTLVPSQICEQFGIAVKFDADLFLTIYSSGDTTIEIQPYMLTMRKNREDGYWAPLPICERIFAASCNS